MHIAWGGYLSGVLGRPRDRWRFFGVVLFGVVVGLLVPTRRAAPAPDTAPRLPGL